MKEILILDTETTGFNHDEDLCLEVGVVRWNLESRAIVSCYSGLMHAEENPAQHVNGIPPALVRKAHTSDTVDLLVEMACGVDAVFAYNAAYDKPWLKDTVLADMPWICGYEDFEWPVASHSKSLVNVALAHGVAVVSAHRAIHDCLLLARLLETVRDSPDRLLKALEYAEEKRFECHALLPYARRDEAKKAGFHWNPDEKVWHKTLRRSQIDALPFSCKVVREVVR